MIGYLIGEGGPLAGLVIRLEDDGPWILGRDAKTSYLALEDPEVSRRHIMFSFEEGSFFVENLSSTNPTELNGTILEESTPLNEGDTLQIGKTLFRFTLQEPQEKPTSPHLAEEDNYEKISDTLSLLTLAGGTKTRWIIKVIAGPNTGAEFPLEEGKSYVIGKDPSLCDIFFQDLSVSKQHAKLTLSKEGKLIIEDLGSRNGIIVQGKILEKEGAIHSQEMISLGTTSFLIIDRNESQETLYTTPEMVPHEKSGEGESEPDLDLPSQKNWKELFIPKKHIILACVFTLTVGASLFSVLSLFKTHPIIVNSHEEQDEIERILKRFPSVQYTYTPGSGQLFLLGHVLTDIEEQELTYLIDGLPFITSTQNNVIVDEFVWEDMNALLFKNPDWRSVLVISTQPGHFMIKGYLKSSDQILQLMEYVNANFPYLNKLESQVYVENTLETEIQSLLISKGFVNVNFSLSGGELLLSGRIATKNELEFGNMLKDFRKIQGIKDVKNYVVATSDNSGSRINISAKYGVSGTGMVNNKNEFILINGHLLEVGGALDGLNITQITPNSVLLERDGIKYIIDYNQ